MSILMYVALSFAGSALFGLWLSRRLKTLSEADAPPSEALTQVRRETEHLYCGGLEALRRNDFERAARELGLAAERGHARAQLYFGLLRELGLGVQADLESARHWYRRAAALGDADAYSRLRVLAETQALQRAPQPILEASLSGDEIADRWDVSGQRSSR